MRSIFLFCVFMTSFFALSAQSYERSYDHHDLSIGYGLFIPDQFNKTTSSMFDDLFPDKRYVRDNYSSIGAICVTYRHVLRNELLFIGVSAGFSTSSAEIYNVGQFAGNLDRQFITVAGELEYRYVNQGPVQIYSGIALGFTYGVEKLTPPVESGEASSTGNISTLGYQLNAVGIRLGKKFAGFAEFGYGFKGIVNIGCSLQLF
jgi:hypothetical protein